jgi:hypothetical protein
VLPLLSSSECPWSFTMVKSLLPDFVCWWKQVELLPSNSQARRPLRRYFVFDRVFLSTIVHLLRNPKRHSRIHPSVLSHCVLCVHKPPALFTSSFFSFRRIRKPEDKTMAVVRCFPFPSSHPRSTEKIGRIRGDCCFVGGAFLVQRRQYGRFPRKFLRFGFLSSTFQFYC